MRYRDDDDDDDDADDDDDDGGNDDDDDVDGKFDNVVLIGFASTKHSLTLGT